MDGVLARALSLGVHRSPAFRAMTREWQGRAALACSGGVDSTALLVLAALAASRGDIVPFIVVHVDHRTRPETRAEGEFVVELCRELRRPVVRTTVSYELGASTGESVEGRLRQARYDAIAAAGRALGLDSVVTAHTLDDQAETILMRLLAGSGPLAAAGMRVRQRLETRHGPLTIIRPLLGVSRSQLSEMLSGLEIHACQDPTNRDVRYRRNALRNLVIPKLREHVPGFENALIRSVSLAARDAEVVDEVARAMYGQIVHVEDHEMVTVDRDALRSAHPALASRIIRRAVERLMGADTRELSFERIESVRKAASGRTGALIELPGNVLARIERATVRLQRGSGGGGIDQS